MSRISLPGFLGPTNQLDPTFVFADASRSVNLALVRIPPGITRASKVWQSTPGLRPLYILGSSPVRALFEQDGRAFAVGGGNFYELFASGAVTSYGAVSSDADMATIVSNGTAGNQLLIVSGGNGYVFDLGANTLGSAIGGGFPNNALMCEFALGWGIVSVKDSRSWQISALEDFSTWDPLDVAERSIASDNIAGFIRRGSELVFAGTKTSEVWGANGDPLFPWAPVSNTAIPHGCAGGFTLQRIRDTVAWCDQNELGQGVVVLMSGYTPDRISTYSIDMFIRRAGVEASGNLTLSRGWTYQENGHDYYTLMIPEADASLSVDMTSPSDSWHERARGVCGGDLLPNVVQCHCFAFGKHLVGDRFSGAIYHQSQDFHDEQIIDP